MYRIPQPIQIGAGVNIDSVERMRDMFTDRQVRSASAELGDHETTVRYYDRIEALINEPTATEFNGQLDRFWNAWSELALHPSNLSARAVVLEEGAREPHHERACKPEDRRGQRDRFRRQRHQRYGPGDRRSQPRHPQAGRCRSDAERPA
jgi:glycine cleavage system protein P-like pyridoxal-binding family